VRTHTRLLIVLLALLVPLTFPALAEDGTTESPQDETAKPSESEADDDSLVAVIRRSFEGLERVTGDIEFSAEDLALLLEHHKSVEALLEEDEDFYEALDESILKAFEHLLRSVAFQAWALDHDLDAERFARVIFRVRTGFMKLYFGLFLQEMLARQRQVLAELRDELEEDQFNEISAELDNLEAEFARTQTELDKAPGPTEAEAALLKAHRRQLSEMFDMPLPEEEPAAEEPEKEDTPERDE